MYNSQGTCVLTVSYGLRSHVELATWRARKVGVLECCRFSGGGHSALSIMADTEGGAI